MTSTSAATSTVNLKISPWEEKLLREKNRRTITLYRDDSTVQVHYDNVKTFFWTARNTVLTISCYHDDESPDHYYVHWPRERFCWFRDSG